MPHSTATGSDSKSISFTSTQEPSISNTRSPSPSTTLTSSQTGTRSQTPSISSLPAVIPLPSVAPSALYPSVLNLTASINAYLDLLDASGVSAPGVAAIDQSLQVLRVVPTLAVALNAASAQLANPAVAGGVSAANLSVLQLSTTATRERLLSHVIGYLPAVEAERGNMSSAADVLPGDLLTVAASALASVAAIPTELSAASQSSILSAVATLLAESQYVDVPAGGGGVAGRSSWTVALPTGALQDLLDATSGAALSATLALTGELTSLAPSDPSATVVVYLPKFGKRVRSLWNDVPLSDAPSSNVGQADDQVLELRFKLAEHAVAARATPGLRTLRLGNASPSPWLDAVLQGTLEKVRRGIEVGVGFQPLLSSFDLHRLAVAYWHRHCGVAAPHPDVRRRRHARVVHPRGVQGAGRGIQLDNSRVLPRVCAHVFACGHDCAYREGGRCPGAGHARTRCVLAPSAPS